MTATERPVGDTSVADIPVTDAHFSRNDPAATRHGRQLAFGLLAIVLVVLIAPSASRRVGDGGDYMAMAYAISTGHSPALSPTEWKDTQVFFNSLGPRSGFPGTLPDIAVFQNSEHAQNFAHFWMYSLLAAPGLAVTRLLGADPNWGFVLVNLALFLLAAWLALRRLGLAGTWFLFLSPIVWWLDKAHTEAFTFSLLTLAFLELENAPWWSFLCLGLAATQNPPIALVIPVALAAALWRDRTRWRMPRLWFGFGGALLLASLHPVFYEWQLGVLTPESLSEVHAQLPSAAFILTPLLDLNIGLLPDFPMFTPACLVLILIIARRGWRNFLSPELAVAIAAAAIFLLSFAQNSQVNTAGTPGMDRYALWLVPLIIPLILIARRLNPRQVLVWIIPIAAVSSVLSIVSYAPAKAESATTASPLAAYIWQHAPDLYNPVPVIFYDREHGNAGGSALLPTATSTCSKILVVGGHSTATCPIHQVLPHRCNKSSTSICYANQSGSDRLGRTYSFYVWSGNPGTIQ